jgi:hypothetical protein
MCRAAQLEAILRGTSAATGGNVISSVVIRNAGAGACYLDGYPDITIFDAGGHALARASGTANRGTYFPDWPQLPVLVQPGTSPLSPGSEQAPTRGQAIVNAQWYDCQQPTASKLSLDLPQGGGNLTIGYAAKAPYNPTCDSTTPPPGTVSRGPFSPAGYELPGPAFISVDITLSAPASVKRGTTVVYYVTVKNTSSSDYRLDPCPDYVEILGAKNPVAGYQLNCGPVVHIAPGASDKFEMRLSLPASVPTGPTRLQWALVDGRLAVPHATTSISVT